MKTLTYGGYLFTDRFYVKTTQDRCLDKRREIHCYFRDNDDSRVQLIRVCFINDPYYPIDRYAGFLPLKDELPESLRQLDVTDLILVDYENFKLIRNSVNNRLVEWSYFLNLVSGSIDVEVTGKVIGGIMPIETGRLQALLFPDE